VIDPSFRTSVGSNVYNHDAPTILLHSPAARKGKLEDVRRRGVLTVCLPARRGRIPFRAIVRKLRDLGIRRILIEGGGETLASAFAAGVVTDVMFFISPMLLGGKGAKTPIEGAGAAALADATRLSGMKARLVGPDILLTGQVRAKGNRRRK
jgi:diaminohydroxyphosphoribosylaminopyrimidine deaminase/5-amino-6-(5-phosphoribosylamino)uracil reductase